MSRAINYSIIKGQVWCSKTKKVERQEFKTTGKYMRSCDRIWVTEPCDGDHYLIHKGEKL